MTEKAVAPYNPGDTTAVTDARSGNRLTRDITTKDVAALKSTFAQGLDDNEMRVVVEYCRRTGLDPIAREIHVWKDRGKLTLHIGIEDLRRRAMETRLFEGLELQWCGPDGNWRDEWLASEAPFAARCVIYRRGVRVPFKAVVKMSEFRKSGEGATNWNSRPAHMLGIRAQTHAFRMAFPQETGPLFDALPRNMRGDIEVVDADGDEDPDGGQYVAQIAAPAEFDDAIDVTPAPRAEPVRPHIVHTQPAEEVFAEQDDWDLVAKALDAPDGDMILAAVDEAPPPPEASPAPAAAPAPEPEPEQPKAMPSPGPKQLRVAGMLTAATGDWLTIERDQGSPVTIRVPANYAGLRPSEAHVGNGITVIVSGKQSPFTLEQIGSIETPNRAQGALV